MHVLNAPQRQNCTTDGRLAARSRSHGVGAFQKLIHKTRRELRVPVQRVKAHCKSVFDEVQHRHMKVVWLHTTDSTSRMHTRPKKRTNWPAFATDRQGSCGHKASQMTNTV